MSLASPALANMVQLIMHAKSEETGLLCQGDGESRRDSSDSLSSSSFKIITVTEIMLECYG